MEYLKETYEISQGNLRNISRKPMNYLRNPLEYLKETYEISQEKLWNIAGKPTKYLEKPMKHLKNYDIYKETN